MFGVRIKRLRMHMGLSQKDFAARLNISQPALQKWESDKGQMRESSLRAIESTFCVSSEWLREGKGEMFSLDLAKQKAFEQLGIKEMTDIPPCRAHIYVKLYQQGAKEVDPEKLIIAIFRALNDYEKADMMNMVIDKYNLHRLRGEACKNQGEAGLLMIGNGTGSLLKEQKE